MKTVRDILIAELKRMGADGLCGENCGCAMDDLPCAFENDITECEPARRKIATAEDVRVDADFSIGDEIYVPMEET